MRMNDYETGTSVKEILDYYSGLKDRSSQEMIVNMLRELQEALGCISPAILEAAAKTAGVKPSTVQTILKRYPSLKQAPYVHEIVVCTGRNCAGANMDVLLELRQRLEVNRDGISGDGRIYLRTSSCLKHCRTAPNILVDGALCSGKSAKEILEMVKE